MIRLKRRSSCPHASVAGDFKEIKYLLLISSLQRLLTYDYSIAGRFTCYCLLPFSAGCFIPKVFYRNPKGKRYFERRLGISHWKIRLTH